MLLLLCVYPMYHRLYWSHCRLSVTYPMLYNLNPEVERENRQCQKKTQIKNIFFKAHWECVCVPFLVHLACARVCVSCILPKGCMFLPSSVVLCVCVCIKKVCTWCQRYSADIYNSYGLLFVLSSQPGVQSHHCQCLLQCVACRKPHNTHIHTHTWLIDASLKWCEWETHTMNGAVWWTQVLLMLR